MFQLWRREDQPLRVEPDSVPVPPLFADTPAVRRSLARYYDNLMEFDAWIGDILGQLEADGLLESTAIFVFSDHGWAMPRGKIWLYDAGLRVPLLVRLPGARRGGESDPRLVSFVDFAPTALGLAGVAPASPLDGRPFLPEAGEAPPRDYIFAAKDRIDFHIDRIRAVRDRRFKYIRNYFPEKPYLLEFPWIFNIPLMQEMQRLHDAGALDPVQDLFFAASRPEEELYDTEADPWETRNLAGHPAYADVLRRLRHVNDVQVRRTGDLGFVDETLLRTRMWPGGEQPVTPIPNVRVQDLPDGWKSVVLMSDVPGVSLIYQIHEGASPDEDLRWELYHGKPIRLPPGLRLSARAVRYGWADSEVVEAL